MAHAEMVLLLELTVIVSSTADSKDNALDPYSCNSSRYSRLGLCCSQNSTPRLTVLGCYWLSSRKQTSSKVTDMMWIRTAATEQGEPAFDVL